MTFSFNKKTTINNLKDWIVEQINSNCIVDDRYYDNNDDNKLNILEYLISEIKIDMVDYLINLGMEYDYPTILKSDNIDFIKKHIDVTQFSISFFDKKILMDYIFKENLANDEVISNAIYYCKDKIKQFELLQIHINKFTVKQLSNIFSQCCNLYYDDNFQLFIEIINFIVNHLDNLENSDNKLNLSFVSTQIKSWFQGDNYGTTTAYRNSNSGYNESMCNQHIFIMKVIHLALEKNLLDPNLKTYKTEEKTLFQEALQMNFPITELKFLIETGANVKFINKHNQNYLFYCKTDEHTKFLLSVGLDAKSLNVSDQTPLFFVNSCEQIKMLIEAGADPAIKSKLGFSAYDKYIKLHEAQQKNPSHYSYKANYKVLADEILKYLPISQKFTDPNTKLSDLSVDDLMTFLRTKGMSV